MLKAVLPANPTRFSRLRYHAVCNVCHTLHGTGTTRSPLNSMGHIADDTLHLAAVADGWTEVHRGATRALLCPNCGTRTTEVEVSS